PRRQLYLESAACRLSSSANPRWSESTQRRSANRRTKVTLGQMDERSPIGYSSVMKLRIFRGRPLPLGVTAVGNAANFALLCKHGTTVRLVLEPLDGKAEPTEIALDPQK